MCPPEWPNSWLISGLQREVEGSRFEHVAVRRLHRRLLLRDRHCTGMRALFFNIPTGLLANAHASCANRKKYM